MRLQLSKKAAIRLFEGKMSEDEITRFSEADDDGVEAWAWIRFDKIIFETDPIRVTFYRHDREVAYMVDDGPFHKGDTLTLMFDDANFYGEHRVVFVP